MSDLTKTLGIVLLFVFVVLVISISIATGNTRCQKEARIKNERKKDR